VVVHSDLIFSVFSQIVNGAKFRTA